MRIPAKVVKDMERRKKAFITDGRSRKFIEECVADGQREVTKDPPTFQEICDSAPPPVRKTIENPECIHGIIQYSVICLKCNPEPEHVKQATPQDCDTYSHPRHPHQVTADCTPAPRPVVDEEAEKGQPDTRTIQEVLRLHVTSSGSMESTYRDTANSDMLQWQEGFTEGLKRAIEVADNLAVRTEAARAAKEPKT